MSQWDFGYGREPAEHHEPQYAAQPPYGYPEQTGREYSHPRESPQQYAQAEQYPQAPQYPFGQPAPYPQPPTGPGGIAHLPTDAGWPPHPGQPADTSWPAAAGQSTARWPAPSGWPTDAGQPGIDGQFDGAAWPDATGYADGTESLDDEPAPYPITYERDGFEGRAALPTASPATATPSYPPWADAQGPAARISGAQPASQPWYPPPPAGRSAGRQPTSGPWRPPPPAGRRASGGQTRAPRHGQPPAFPDDAAYDATGGVAAPRSRARRARRGDDAWQQDGYVSPQGDPIWPPGGPPPLPQAGPWPHGDEADWDEEDDPDTGRWMIPAALAVAGAAVGAAIVMFALGHSRPTAGTASPTTSASAAGQAGVSSPPLTLAAAKNVLAGYTAANNSANADRSAATLASVETAGSYAIDAELYRVQLADGTAPSPSFAPVNATYYLPRSESAGGPRWFVVEAANAFTANPGTVTSTEYLLFTQVTAGGRWQNATEPYLTAGASAPPIAVGGDGLATAVSADATTLAVPPSQLAAQTAAAIDGTRAGVTVPDPGALADRAAEASWRGQLPTATVTDAHAAATGAEGDTFALLTTDGGALVFYADAAEVTITPPPGSALHLTVPGAYSSAQALSRAGLGYLDQFAADDPPAGAGTPRVIAAYSGLTGKN